MTFVIIFAVMEVKRVFPQGETAGLQNSAECYFFESML